MTAVHATRMNMVPIKTAIAVSVSLATDAWAESSPPIPTAGATYELIKSYETEQRSDGSSGSSSGHDTLLERVIAVRDAGIELEYDLSKDADADDRARNWQFPARVFKPSNGPIQLLNATEMEARVESWLKAAGWDRSVCGRWIFTWNAFRIDCDPQSVIEIIEAIDLRSIDLHEGASYQDTEALAPGVIARTAAGPNGETFVATLEIDPVAVRRQRAEADVATGEIMRKPVTMEAALSERAKERTSGTISVTFETDAAGNIWKRTKVTKLAIKRADGTSERQTATETLERRALQ